MLNQKPALNNQKYEEPKAHVYNPTLEPLRAQVNSRGFTFEAMELTEIPLSMAEEIGKAIAYKGLFVVWPNQNIEDLENVKIAALRNFKDFNDSRLQAEQAYLDERRKAGVTIDMSTQYNYNKWLKWSQEIEALLKVKNVIKDAGSFLEAHKKVEKQEEAPKRRPGRPSLNEATV